METVLKRMIKGYRLFRSKYVEGDNSVMHQLSDAGQSPEIMVVACCDSRVDPALILQCDPGDLFVVRNVANIIPPCEIDSGHHGTSAALEFGICGLKVKHLIILGHSQCGGIKALLSYDIEKPADDFVTNWVSLINIDQRASTDPDNYAKLALKESYKNCLTFPWIKERLENNKLTIDLWFFDIKDGEIYTYSPELSEYRKLD